MKCINCEFYNPLNGDIEAGCVNDGDVTNPEEDINCAEAGDEELSA